GLAAGHGEQPARCVPSVRPAPAGGGTDIVGRVLAQHFSRAFGQPFFVENKAGAGTMIGIESVARAAPDGYTLLMVPSTLALNSVLYKKPSYDPVRDFAPITLAASAPNILVVNPALPARSLAEFIALAKARPRGATRCASSCGSRRAEIRGHAVVRAGGAGRHAAADHRSPSRRSDQGAAHLRNEGKA